ncbi:MAG: DUF4157 domain-containing protein [Pelatocladus maniniholoensis HA4357-MV3]|jgi:glycerophosphoryl diester phosphodiesterase|uniref:DUF4157 domain-containing protein n=1 Tax=Pelatocladus maniniholoensis HA4357-MV3 TaxID=1117104 RepID=A0A9E3LUT4_9NOST|nr:DUF4157 domain-containing protein [Pelatocladus maniniholoensis HA4357-MV3]
MFYHQQRQISKKSNKDLRKRQQTTYRPVPQTNATHPAILIQRVKLNPNSLNTDDVLTLQETIGNRAATQLLANSSGQYVQPKLTIGEPGDKYEQEADQVAAEFVQYMNAPALLQASQNESIQRQDMEDDELNMKPMLQRQPDGGAATSDLETSINQARGGGQPLADNIREPIEQALGADFSGVKIHTDAQSDQLNQSIQARAFTTGQDVFFRQGEYNPKSRGGQELLAHELTHVVQQSGGTVQRSPYRAEDFAAISNHDATNPPQIQLYSAMEASELIENKYKAWRQWYYEVCIPAMQTIAAKAGQDFNQYLATKSQDEFEQAMTSLHTEAKDERYSSWSENFRRLSSTDNSLVQSDKYPGMNRVSRTNILVSNLINENDENLQRFITLYNSDDMTWYRGLSISHFSYKQLREAGVLGSEGTADIPTFTMDNDSPTRWLPGLYNAQLADAVAHRVDAEDAGIREIAMRKDIPIGVTVQYPIKPPTHVAFLNDGEQVIRGPITGARVYRVILLGPSGYSYRLKNGSTNDLPPAAPYQASAGSQAIMAWETAIDTWLLNHP